MSETTAPTTALAVPKTVDDVIALLRVGEQAIEHTGEKPDDAPAGVQSVAWVGYRTPKSKAKISELVAAGVEDNTFYLYDKGVIYPKPFYIHLIAAFRYFSQVDRDNNTTGLAAKLTPELKGRGYTDHVGGVVLVRLPGDAPMFKVATFGLRKAMVRAVDDIRNRVESFEKDRQGREWRSYGERHKLAFDAAKWPAFAVRARIWVKTQASTKPGGDDYSLGLSAVEPTPMPDVEALNRYMGYSPESYGGEMKKNTEFAAALRVFGLRRQEVLKGIAEQQKREADAAPAG